MIFSQPPEAPANHPKSYISKNVPFSLLCAIILSLLLPICGVCMGRAPQEEMAPEMNRGRAYIDIVRNDKDQPELQFIDQEGKLVKKMPLKHGPIIERVEFERYKGNAQRQIYYSPTICKDMSHVAILGEVKYSWGNGELPEVEVKSGGFKYMNDKGEVLFELQDSVDPGSRVAMSGNGKRLLMLQMEHRYRPASDGNHRYHYPNVRDENGKVLLDLGQFFWIDKCGFTANGKYGYLRGTKMIGEDDTKMADRLSGCFVFEVDTKQIIFLDESKCSWHVYISEDGRVRILDDFEEGDKKPNLIHEFRFGE